MIRIIKGVYGHVPNPDTGIVVPKTSKDEPFSLSPEQEKRLVSIGVAEYVDAPAAPTETGPEDVDDAPEAETEVPAGEAEDDGAALDEMSAKELREYGKELGLTFRVGMTKAEMREAIVAAEDAAEPEDDEAPPAFDAAEAVM